MTHADEFESARLAALSRSRLLDSEADERFDRVTRLVTMSLNVPVALVSLVDRDRQFFKSAVGLPEPWAVAKRRSAILFVSTSLRNQMFYVLMMRGFIRWWPTTTRCAILT